MAGESSKKKKKLSKGKLKRIASKWGKTSAEKQGKGAGSRKKFSLPAKWKEDHTEKDGKMHLKFVSPGKTEYASENSVAKTLTARNLEACFNASSASSEDTGSEQSEYLPDIDQEETGCSTDICTKNQKRKNEDEPLSQPPAKKSKLDIERRLFVGESTQIMDFVEQVNETCCCSTPDCTGKISMPQFCSYTMQQMETYTV